MVKIDYDYRTNDDAIAWCRAQFGRDGFRITGSSTFYFTSLEDASFFSLRWA